jgi:hypothetical protein
MERTSEKLITEDTVPLPAELNELKEIADNKIETQKENIASEENKVQEEEAKIEAVKSVLIKEQEVQVPVAVPPVVNVKVNIQGQGQDAPIQSQPLVGGKTRKSMKKGNKKTKKCK